MHSLWNDAAAREFIGALGPRVYTSRLLGRDKTLVLHGGGNTSVKLCEPDLSGLQEDILYVKGSGWDLETIEARGFSPCRMQRLLEIAQLPALSDTHMANELRQSMKLSSAPAPSVEAILHALLPHKYVDHTHADAIIAITNTPNGAQRIAEIFGDRLVIIPYVMPGFKLARAVAEIFHRSAKSSAIGLILLNHGIFSFGDDARTSYERMIALVSEAEAYLERHNAFHIEYPLAETENRLVSQEIAEFRRALLDVAGQPMVVVIHQDRQSLGFARHPDVSLLASQGPLTPDHVIRTKRLPLIGRDLDAYRLAYTAYFRAHTMAGTESLTMLDPAPRVVVDKDWGLLTAGRTAVEVVIVEEIYRHTIEGILRATALGGYKALPANSIFEVEYWDLEQAKLRGQGTPPPFAGEIALVTGAASGIGRACAEALLTRGAAVVGVDINPAVEKAFSSVSWLGIQRDLGDEGNVRSIVEMTIRHFGGLDMLILNAGIFPPSTPISSLALTDWSRVMRINLDANLILMRDAYPFLKLAPRSGRAVIVGSKNVRAPGPGASAYSASKAALTQLARVAALEWGRDGIRINVVHPNAVFDTGLWTNDVVAKRAAHYGLSEAEYRKNNVLGTEITSRDVGEMVATLCSPIFSRTTGAQIPIDGGNDRVI
ncbi:MAG: bifunctional aldolase/short-chain dehydrogenase [Chthoniobacterales bacterium]|nr:MAG: bifunctional aldolase/short-chain dehydrogenase [Chthoniobacterales bacterium]